MIRLLFFCSGFTALAYELVWQRLLTGLGGTTPQTVGMILASYMAGLSLGSWLAGRWIGIGRRPAELLVGYGICELAVGVLGIAMPMVSQWPRPVLALLYRHAEGYPGLFAAGAGMFSFFLMLIPSTLMGATLPLLVQYAARGGADSGRQAGWLYGINTVGAAAGAASTGLCLIPVLGIWGVSLGAGLANLGIAGAALGWARHRGGGENRAAAREPAAEATPLRGLLPVLLISGTAGFCGLAYETAWTRLLALLVAPTTYSFTVILFTFIAGLGLGAMVGVGLRRWAGVARRFDAILGVLAVCGLVGILGSQLMGNGQLFFAKLAYHHGTSFFHLKLLEFGAIGGLVLPYSLLSGALFPLLVDAAAAAGCGAGRASARVYSINTLGAVAGAAVMTFGLIPLLGTARAISILGLAQGAVTLALCGVRPRGRLRLAVAAAGLLTILVAGVLPSWNLLFLSEGKYHRLERIGKELEDMGYGEALLSGNRRLDRFHAADRLLYSAEGPGGFVAVTESVNSLGATNRMLSLTGKLDASSRVDRDTQVLSAHIPMLFHPNPEEVLVIGLASGMTAGEMLHYPVRRLDVVEISPEVAVASGYFREWNGGVLDSDRTRLIIQDARVHVALTDRKYDVVSSEPSNPWMAGVANLYTREYFEQIRGVLKPGGIFVQFFHSYQMDWDTFAMVGRTLAGVFPRSSLFVTSPGGTDFLFVGHRDAAGRCRLEVAEKNLALARRSKLLNLRRVESLFPFMIAENLAEVFGAGVRHTDDRPVLEFAAGRLLFHQDPELARQLMRHSRLTAESLSVLERSRDPGIRLETVAMLVSLGRRPFGVVKPAELNAEQSARYGSLIQAYASENPPMPMETLGEWERVIAFRVALERMTERLAVLRRTGAGDERLARQQEALAWLCWDGGDRMGSIRWLEAAWQASHEDPETSFRLLRAYGIVRDVAAFERVLERVLSRRDLSPRLRRQLGELQTMRGARQAHPEAF